MKKVIVIVSKNFPKSHSKAGKETLFIEGIKDKTKIHTIRESYLYWEKKMKLVLNGEANLHIRSWIGEPYKSKQEEHFVLSASDGVGIEFVRRVDQGFLLTGSDEFLLDRYVSKNDGLSFLDFKEWFKKVEEGETLAIIHFTRFRYRGYAFNGN